MHRDCLGNGVGPRVVQTRHQHVAHKDLLALRDVENHVHLGRIFRLVVFLHFHVRLVEAARKVVRHQCVAVAGQVARREQLPRFRVHQRQQLPGFHVIIPVQFDVAHALLLPFVDVVNHLERRRLCFTPVGVPGRIGSWVWQILAHGVQPGSSPA